MAADIIRCICKNPSPTDSCTFVQCSTCHVWQHNTCQGLPSNPQNLPEDYYCERCSPGDHPRIQNFEHQTPRQIAEIRNRLARGEFADEERDDLMVAECMALVNRIEVIEDYWALYLPPNASRKWPLGGDAGSKEVVQVRDGIFRSIEILLSHAEFAIVESFRDKMVKGLHDSPVVVVGFLWELRRLLTREMVEEIRVSDEEVEERNVLFYFGKGEKGKGVVKKGRVRKGARRSTKG